MKIAFITIDTTLKSYKVIIKRGVNFKPKLLLYLSRVKNFVFLFPWDSIAVNAGSMCSTLSANRSDESDSKRTTISFSSHENIEVRFITGCCGKLWKRLA